MPDEPHSTEPPPWEEDLPERDPDTADIFGAPEPAPVPFLLCHRIGEKRKCAVIAANPFTTHCLQAHMNFKNVSLQCLVLMPADWSLKQRVRDNLCGGHRVRGNVLRKRLKMASLDKPC